MCVPRPRTGAGAVAEAPRRPLAEAAAGQAVGTAGATRAVKQGLAGAPWRGLPLWPLGLGAAAAAGGGGMPRVHPSHCPWWALGTMGAPW